MPFDWDIEVFETLSSTQDLCKERAVAGAGEGAGVQAICQSAGRGRRGRVWFSGQGNLTFSFVLRPGCDVSLIGQISVLMGVALARTIGDGAVLKWPNDVFVSGKKCAGVLIDSDLDGRRVRWLVVGIGVNTANAPDMGMALGIERDGFLGRLLEQIAVCYEGWRARGFEEFREEWLGRTYAKGTKLNAGLFETLDGFGNLVVRGGQNRLQTISAGDVYLKDCDDVAGD
ncbi:MAG: biotin--[acetyl-CoA-carboxylase] ligase [Alphaproteobacteria bacterium]